MAIKRPAVPKPQPDLYFERVPVEIAKEVAKTAEKKPKVRLATRRSIVRER
jgi:hypothetical protein